MCKKKKWRLVNGKNEMDLRQMEQKLRWAAALSPQQLFLPLP